MLLVDPQMFVLDSRVGGSAISATRAKTYSETVMNISGGPISSSCRVACTMTDPLSPLMLLALVPPDRSNWGKTDVQIS
jgi:hypothetical protein